MLPDFLCNSCNLCKIVWMITGKSLPLRSKIEMVMKRINEDIFKRESDMLKRMLADADIRLEKLPLDRLFIEDYSS